MKRRNKYGVEYELYFDVKLWTYVLLIEDEPRPLNTNSIVEAESLMHFIMDNYNIKEIQ